MIYEWDPKKAKANLRKHRVSFEEAATVFLDPYAITYPDPDHSVEEFREITVGHSAKLGVIFLSHTQRGNRIRIIGARKATRWERKQYEESISKEK
ncbi:MAG: BrnT family toxin [Acidobacteriota bacterium]